MTIYTTRNYKNIILQTQKIKDDLKLQTDNNYIIMEVAEGLQQSEVILQKGEVQQKQRENIMTQANASYEKADQAVKLGVRIKEEAQKTLNTLQGENAIIVTGRTSYAQARPAKFNFNYIIN